jgi:hypothetical protein
MTQEDHDLRTLAVLNLVLRAVGCLDIDFAKTILDSQTNPLPKDPGATVLDASHELHVMVHDK